MPTLKNNNISSRKILGIAFVLSLVIGSFSGFFFGMVGGLFSSRHIYSLNEEGRYNSSKTVAVEEEASTIGVSERVSDSVVNVMVSKDLGKYYNQTGPLSPYDSLLEPDPFDFYSQDEGVTQEIGGGTGFVISADGMILTNKHVVSDEDAEYTVILADGTKYEAEILGRDPVNDIAVLKIEAEGLRPVELGDSDKIKIGQTVIAIGNTLSEYKNTVTKGVVSGIDRRVTANGDYGQTETLEEAIQTDAAINPGNSGGPLLDLEGRVIGINTAVSNLGQSIGFAIPINTAKRVIESVQEHGRIVRPFLGVRYVILNESIRKSNNLDVDYGALIVRGSARTDLAVIPGSAADKAGLVENDIILEADGQKITQSNSLGKILNKYQPQDKITLKVLHKGGEKFVNVILDEYKDTK